MIIDRDAVRKMIAQAGITTENVTVNQLNLLHDHINNRMKESSDCYHGTMRMNGDGGSQYMTCRTEEWESREAVSFNRDGFIGIAGWADEKNVQPILCGLINWVVEVRGHK